MLIRDVVLRTRRRSAAHFLGRKGLFCALLAFWVGSCGLNVQPQSDEVSWTTYGNDFENQRYSTLSQINRENVGRLSLHYGVHTGTVGPFETSPIVSDGVVYLTTAYDGVLALNASTGRLIWRRKPLTGTYVQCCGPVNRGVAIDEQRLFIGLLNGRIAALSRRTGELLWDKSLGSNRAGVAITMAPLLYRGVVIVGTAGGQFGIRGSLSAFNSKTGALLWRWYSTRVAHWSEPFGLGTKSSARRRALGNSDQPGLRGGGGAVWTTPAIDVQNQEVIFGTGNPWPPFDGRTRPGRNLYTDCIIALHIGDGKMRWYFQEVQHDVEDLDVASPPVLFDTVDGEGRRIAAVGQAGKTGYFYVLNRRTGRLLRRTSLLVNTSRGGTTNWTTGASWSPVSYDPERHLAIISAAQRLRPRLGASSSTGGVLDPRNWEKGFGTVSAVNVETGAMKWQDRFDVGIVGGSTSTAGGLTLVGEGGGTFDALDTDTGRKLWQYRTTAGVNAPPVVFAENRHELIAVAAGGNQQLGTKVGDMFLVFGLP